MKICTRADSVEKKDGRFLIRTDSVDIYIWFITDSIVRIRAGFGESLEEESYSLVLTAWEDRLDAAMEGERERVIPAEATMEDFREQTVLRGKDLEVVVEKNPFRICIFDSDHTLLHADIADLAFMEDSNHRRIHTSEVMEGDCFYGFGEKTGTINKAQKFLSMSPKDAMGYNPKETDSLYKHIPFYIKLNKQTKKACGYFYHNTWECDFDMGREKSNYWKPHSRYRTDGGDIDLFFIAGSAVRDVISRYTDLTGKSAMMPRYALGYLGSSMYYSELDVDCDDGILEFIDTTREEELPIDGFQLSSGYTVQETTEGNKRCVFTWNKKRFKDPKEFSRQMEERGITVSANVKPGVLLAHPDIEQMKSEDMFVKNSRKDGPGIGSWWGGKGCFADFTNPRTRSIWKEMLKTQVLAMGIPSVWNDNCEYDSLVDKDCFCDFEGKGGTIGQLKSVMANLMCQTAQEAIQETYENTRPYIVCRSGHSGIQRYAQTWAGDNLTCWDSLKYNIATILGMSLSGVANQGCDIGGFYGPAPDAELLVRWIQNGIFQPRFSIHSVNLDNTVTEPWMYGACTEYIRDAIRFRYRLIPYLYSLMERAYETGLPIMEPMFSTFQQDIACYEEGIDFMLGDSLLVANVVEKGAKTRLVYLPEGEVFYDFYSRECYEGGQTIEIPVDISSIPLFIRGGGIIPVAVDQLYNLKSQYEEEICLICVDDRNSEFVMYEDDGLTLEYKKGNYLKTKIKMSMGIHTIIDFKAEGSYTTKVKRINLDIIHREKAPLWIKAGGELLPHYLYKKKFEEAACGWYYSPHLKSIQVKYPNPYEKDTSADNSQKDYAVEISYKELDMIGM